MFSLHQIFIISFKLHYEQDVMPYVACRSLITGYIKQQHFDNEVNVQVSVILIWLQVYFMLYTIVGMSYHIIVIIGLKTNS